MKRLFFLLPVLFFIKVSAQETYYDFKKFNENNLAGNLLKKYPGKTQLLRGYGKNSLVKPNGTFILPFDKNITIDSLQTIIGTLQKPRKDQNMGAFVYAKPDGTRICALLQDNMLFLCRICHYSICL